MKIDKDNDIQFQKVQSFTGLSQAVSITNDIAFAAILVNINNSICELTEKVGELCDILRYGEASVRNI